MSINLPNQIFTPLPTWNPWERTWQPFIDWMDETSDTWEDTVEDTANDIFGGDADKTPKKPGSNMMPIILVAVLAFLVLGTK